MLAKEHQLDNDFVMMKPNCYNNDINRNNAINMTFKKVIRCLMF